MSLLGRPTPATLSEQAIRQTMFDDLLFSEMRVTSPAMDDMIDALNQDYGYTDVLVSDVFAALYQAAPLLRDRAEMVAACLLNHAVAVNLSRAPEVTSLRGYTQHDKYYATMGTVELVGKVREYLAQAEQDMAQAAKQDASAKAKAEQAEQDAAEQQVATSVAQDASAQASADVDDAQADAAAAQAALEAAMAGFDGNGPFTQAQADALQAAADAADAVDAATTAYEAAADAAAVSAEQLTLLLALAEAARQEADTTGEQVAELAERAERATRNLVAQAVHEAVEHMSEQAAQFRAWGTGPGELERMSFAERAAKARRLKNHRLKDWVKELGRWKAMRAAQYAKKVAAARDEVFDVTHTGHLPDVLPSQFAMLSTQPGTIDFLQRLTERQLLGLKYRGKEKIGQGALIVLMDTSSSMKQTDTKGSPREVFCKGMGLAMLDQARDEKRDFVGIIFGNASHQRVWHFPKGQGCFDDVLDMTELFFGGGTDFQVPLDLAMDILEKQYNHEALAKGDIILITDDDCAVSAQWFTAYQLRKAKLDFRTFGVAVGMARAGGTLTKLSDDVRSVLEFHDPSVVADIVRTV